MFLLSTCSGRRACCCSYLEHLDVVNHCLCRKAARDVVDNFTEIKLKAYDFYTSVLINETMLDPSLIPSQDSCIEENQALLILSVFRVEVDFILQLYGSIMVFLWLDGPSWKDSECWLSFDPGTSTCDWLGLEYVQKRLSYQCTTDGVD
jgi:hypothetical protein